MINKDSFSGSKFELFEKKNKIFIKKKIKKITLRDKKSFIKQNDFKKFWINQYKVEAAIIEKINLKKNFINIKYHEGLSGSDLILNSDLSVHKVLNKFLEKYLINLVSNSKFCTFERDLYNQKCFQIEKNISKKNKKKYKKLFKKIYSKMDNVKYNLIGNCHGDLTLSNIIVNKNKKKIILIDFLKTFWDSPIQDICKLIQDLRLYWTSRKFLKTDEIRAKIFCDNLNPFKSIKENSLIDIIELEMLITLARIIPYIPSDDFNTHDWIERSYKKIDNKFINDL